MSEMLAFVPGDAPPGARSSTVRIRKLTYDGVPHALIRVGRCDAVVTDPKALMELAAAFAQLADDAALAAETVGAS